jgi:hypothetical protein
LNNENVYSLTYDTAGTVGFKLPVGLSTDSYKLYLYVKIIDDLNTITIFNIPTSVTVTVDDAYATSMATDLTSGNSSTLALLQSASPASVAAQAQAIASTLSQSNSTSQVC